MEKRRKARTTTSTHRDRLARIVAGWRRAWAKGCRQAVWIVNPNLNVDLAAGGSPPRHVTAPDPMELNLKKLNKLFYEK